MQAKQEWNLAKEEELYAAAGRMRAISELGAEPLKSYGGLERGAILHLIDQR
jgi:hypothetical protein